MAADTAQISFSGPSGNQGNYCENGPWGES